MSAYAHLPTLSDAATVSPTVPEVALRLIELLQSASEWHDDDATIYVAHPWSCEADAVIITPAPIPTDPVERDATSYSYFLDALIARDFIKDYAALNKGASASDRERCERLIGYAQDDA